MDVVVLSGGVFQNWLLLDDLKNLFRGMSYEVWTNSAVPTNDGGISLGQAAIAALGKKEFPQNARQMFSRLHRRDIDTYPIVLPNYGSFDNGIDMQGFGNFRYREMCLLETHHRGARDYAEAAYQRQPSHKSLCQSIGEIFLRGNAR